MRRRNFLASSTAAVGLLSGCLNPGMPKDALVFAAQKSPPGDLHVMSMTDFPPSEQEIVETAIDEEYYHACPDLPESIRSLGSRFDKVDEAYLNDQGTTYGLWIRIEDTVRATTVPPPEMDPSCGWI